MKKSKKQMQGKSGTGKIRNSEDQKQRILGTKNIRKCENRNRQKGASDMDEKKMLDLLRKQAEEFELRNRFRRMQLNRCWQNKRKR